MKMPHPDRADYGLFLYEYIQYSLALNLISFDQHFFSFLFVVVEWCRTWWPYQIVH